MRSPFRSPCSPHLLALIIHFSSITEKSVHGLNSFIIKIFRAPHNITEPCLVKQTCKENRQSRQPGDIVVICWYTAREKIVTENIFVQYAISAMKSTTNRQCKYRENRLLFTVTNLAYIPSVQATTSNNTLFSCQFRFHYWHEFHVVL